ncbi:MAG: helix-turn-helix domain-containing protein [Ktedonobacterales bacterium]|nr:helix-turn-helix domain-containing protein [Ktedonobacterales bacterium]
MDEVTATEAATLTGLSERTIRRKIASGVLRARRVAPNRYAIKVRDLPIQGRADDLAMRMEALEHRVRLLELRLNEVLVRREGTPTLSESILSETAALPELLARLAHETARLAPLLVPPGAAALPPVDQPTGEPPRNSLSHQRMKSGRAREA